MVNILGMLLITGFQFRKEADANILHKVHISELRQKLWENNHQYSPVALYILKVGLILSLIEGIMAIYTEYRLQYQRKH